MKRFTTLIAGIIAGGILAITVSAAAEPERSELLHALKSILFNVHVANDASQPVPVSVAANAPLPVQLAGRKIFRELISAGPGESTLFTNNTSQRLVIELVTATGSGQPVIAILTIHAAGTNGIEYYFLFPGVNLHQPTKLYIEPGESVSQRNGGTGVIYSFSGYYE